MDLQDTGAARPEAPEAKELCQQRTGFITPQRSEEVVNPADTVFVKAKRTDTVSGLAHVLAEGVGGRPIFLSGDLRKHQFFRKIV